MTIGFNSYGQWRSQNGGKGPSPPISEDLEGMELKTYCLIHRVTRFSGNRSADAMLLVCIFGDVISDKTVAVAVLTELLSFCT